MNRREFIHPGQIAQAAGQFLGALEETQTTRPDAAETAVLRATRQAMATNFEVLIPFGTPDSLAIFSAALDEIDRVEQQLTVYRETSEVSRLNRMAASADVPLEAGLFLLLTLAERIHRETERAYDISAGALIRAWGFLRGPRRVPKEIELLAAMQLIGMDKVTLSAAGNTARFLRKGLEINLGSIGKGYALDQVARLLRHEWNLSSALLHGGHSSVYAIGTEPGDERGWLVSIRHPWDPERRLATVRLRDRAMGTSAATFQHLEYNGRKLGHILDPRTGWPAEGMASATVIAETAAEADALSTAFFILGIDKARAYCEAHRGIGAVLLAQGEAARPIIVGFTPPECAALEAEF